MSHIFENLSEKEVNSKIEEALSIYSDEFKEKIVRKQCIGKEQHPETVKAYLQSVGKNPLLYTGTYYYGKLDWSRDEYFYSFWVINEIEEDEVKERIKSSFRKLNYNYKPVKEINTELKKRKLSLEGNKREKCKRLSEYETNKHVERVMSQIYRYK